MQFPRELGNWLSGDLCKVRYFSKEYADLRGVVQAVENDHCLVLLNHQKQPVRIATANLIYWDDDDEFWMMAPDLYHDDDDLNSDDDDLNSDDDDLNSDDDDLNSDDDDLNSDDDK